LAAFAPPLAPEESLVWRRYAAAALRFRWWILGLTALGGLGGAGGSRLMPPRYQAQATIWVQTTEPRGSSRGPIGASQLFESYAWVDLLRSYVVLDEVARDLRLYLQPGPGGEAAFKAFTVENGYRPGSYRLVVDKSGEGFSLQGPDAVELQRGNVGDSIGRAFGFRWAPSATQLPAGSQLTFTIRPLRDAAKRLGDALAVTIDESGNFLRVSLTGRDPIHTAATVNAVVQRYVAVATDLKRAKLTELAKLLAGQFGAAGGNLKSAETALAEYRTRTVTLAREPAASVTPASGAQTSGDYFGLKLEQEQLRRDREAIEHALAHASDSAGSVEGLAFIGAVQRSADLSEALRELTTKQAERRALRYRYTDDHPAVRRAAADIELLERQTIPSLARTLVGELTTRQQVLAPQIDAGGRELQAIPQRAIEEARLKREVDMAVTLYASVQQRYDEARLAEASSIADVRVLDAAVAPQDQLKDVATRLIVMGLVAGLGLGLVGAVVLDRFDPRVRHPDQVTHGIGLPILGVVPRVKDRRAGLDDEHVAQVIEAMRSVRLSLAHAYGVARPIVVTVTSPGVGDGKSFVSANLALAFADAGERTLLIDGDSRRGALHKALQTARKPGLTDILAGRAPLEAVTRATSYPSLHFISGGTRFRDSPELLGSTEMVELLARARSSFRVVLVDSPPLGSGVDPYTLGTLTGNVVLVLRAGTSNLDLVRTQLAMLDQMPIRLLGVVLNDVRPGGAYRYYSYIPGYGTADEGEGFALATRAKRGVL
jgi:capsular exopolysaccharide synthesis family protein